MSLLFKTEDNLLERKRDSRKNNKYHL